MKGFDRRLAAAVARDPVHWLAFGFGAGLAPRAPGTLGSLWALPLAWATAGWPLAWQLALAAALFAPGIWLCGESARRLGTHDHPGIVWDEVVGCYLALLAAPPGGLWLVAGFVIFRAFDVAKPRPIRDLDHRLGGGVGIMLDDVVAAAYAAAVLAALGWGLDVRQ